MAFCLKREERHGLGAVRGKLLDELDLKPIVRRPGGTVVRADGSAATHGPEEEGHVDGEGDAVIVLAGDAVVVEEDGGPELSDGLEAVAAEEVVEEEEVVAGEVEVAELPELV